MIAVAAFPNFRSFDNTATILVAAAPPMLIALGMTFVIITGGIDLSVGSLYVLGGVVSAYASQWGWVAGGRPPLLVCGAIGLIDGLLIAYTRMAPFIVTLAALLGARGLMRAISSEGSTTYLVKSAGYRQFGSGSFLGIGYPVWLAAVVVVIGMVVLSRTRFGHAVYAVGGSEDAASLMGIDVRRTKIAVYLLSGLLAGLAGAVNAAKLGSGVTVLGTGMELDAIAAVVIGGTLLTGGAGTDRRDHRRRAAARRHPEHDQPGRKPQQQLAAGDQRRLPGRGRGGPDLPGPDAPRDMIPVCNRPSSTTATARSARRARSSSSGASRHPRGSCRGSSPTWPRSA